MIMVYVGLGEWLKGPILLVVCHLAREACNALPMCSCHGKKMAHIMHRSIFFVLIMIGVYSYDGVLKPLLPIMDHGLPGKHITKWCHIGRVSVSISVIKRPF